MSLLNLPNELLFQIVGELRHQRHVYAMTLSCRRLYYLLRRYLLQHNVRYSKGSALIWAAKMDRRNLVRRLLRLGAEVDTRGMPLRRITPLHAAAVAGHLGMIELLLKKGGNPEVHGDKGYKPLFLALLARHDKIAIFLFSKMSDPDSPVAGETGYTSLHAACLLQLPKSARMFIESGANVHARTSTGSTPLHLALQLEASDKSNDTTQSSTLELIMLLLAFGSNRDTKAYSLGLQHPEPQVRDLFQDHNSSFPRDTSFISIGRRWWVEGICNADLVFLPMPASLSRPWNERSVQTSREENFLTNIAENMLDDRVFPVLDPTRPFREQRTSASAWDPEDVKKIRENMPVIVSAEEEISSTSHPIELYPKLIGRQSPHPLESAAQLSWRDLRKSKTQPGIEEACSTLKSNTQQPRMQTPNKKRWRPLQLS